MNNEELQQQRDRTKLRERFLKVLNFMEDKQILIETFQGSNVNGVFRSIDYDITNIHVKNLVTPIGCVPEALVRINDVITVSFEINTIPRF